jgi:transposase, IS30 family
VMKKVESKRAKLVAAVTIESLHLYKDRIHAITSDNGKEFACHEKVAKTLDCDYYFAHPYSSWERGLNANANDLIRQFLPKQGRFEELTERSVKRAKGLLNRRPRKTLGFLTPVKVFFGKSFEENFVFQGLIRRLK